MYESIPEAFFDMAGKHPDKPALLYKREGVYFPITYREFSKKVKIFKEWLVVFGITKGDKIAILSENRPEWAISDLSIMSAGAVVVPLHITFNPGAICSVIKHSGSIILIVSNESLLNKVLLERECLKQLEKVIFLETPTAEQKKILGEKFVGWESVFRNNQNKKIETAPLEADDCCSIIYTSGTTGEPKGVILSHRNFLSNVEAVSQAVSIKETDLFLSFLPLSHVLERTTGYYTPIMHGATIAYAENIKQLPANLKEVRPTVIISVPRVFEKFHDAIWDKVNSSSEIKRNVFKWALKRGRRTLSYRLADLLVFKKIRESFGGRLRLAVSGGASLNDSIARFFLKLGMVVLEGYGLTETSPVVSVNRENDFKFGSVGKLIPGVEVKISDRKEILIKGPCVCSGYFKNKEETKKSFNEDGWFCTGDLGFIDKEGFLTIIGRAKEMIVTSGGKNVWPEHVENLLNNDRFISQSMIVGNKRKLISALIIPDWQEVEIYFKQNNLPLQEHDKLVNNRALLAVFQKRLDEKINPNLHDYEQIKKFKLLPREFSQDRGELTATLKLRRHIINRHYQKTIESIYD